MRAESREQRAESGERRGLDLETDEMDFDSMINLRPEQNRSREILDENIREQVESITRALLQD